MLCEGQLNSTTPPGITSTLLLLLMSSISLLPTKPYMYCTRSLSVINGLFGGTSLVPMHYAAEESFAGKFRDAIRMANSFDTRVCILISYAYNRRARYYFSFAAGSMVVITAVWVFLFAYRLVEKGSVVGAVRALPRWHVKELWLPGVLSGVLFSIGEFASIIAVAYLGQGVGNTFVQCKILVAGLWGLLYYK